MPANTEPVPEDAVEDAVSRASAPSTVTAQPAHSANRAQAWKSELVVAIDGPSGSGKSSVAREVATRAGLAYLDTGAMYRALAWWCLESGTDLEDEAAITRAAQTLPLTIGTDPLAENITCNGVDIREAIRSERVTDHVSAVAKVPGAREALISLQRMEIVSNGRRIVAEGRDITTVVAPDASVRILLTASEEARMRRRGLQLGDEDQQRLSNDVAARDAKDSQVNNFTEAAEGVTLVDSTDLDFEQTVRAVIDIIEETARRNAAEAEQAEGGDAADSQPEESGTEKQND